MRTHEFYQKIANTPLKDRDIPLKEGLTLHYIYKRVHAIDEKIRPDIIEKQSLIGIAEEFWLDNK